MMTQRKSMAGLSLVELLVALTIALVAVLAATELYLSTRQTYRVQSMQNRLSEDGRFSMSMIQRMVSQAGFRPVVNPPPLPPPGNWVGPAIKPDAGADGASKMTLRFIGDNANQIDCTGAVVTDAVNETALRIEGDASAGTLLCGPVGATTCAAAGASCWISPGSAGVQLVDFQLQYGVDNKPPTPDDYGCGASVAGWKPGDCIADDYTLATAQATPGGIVAVRACLVLRSDTTDASIAKTAAYKDCSGGDIAGSQDDHKLYRTFRTTVLLRNR